MRALKLAVSFPKKDVAGKNFLSRWFPVPQILYPRAVGVDISDVSIKWIVLSSPQEKERVVAWGEEPLSEGVVTEGVVRDVDALAAALASLKKKLGVVSCAHASLPEEVAYLFSMHVPEGSSRKTILNTIEFELEGRVPIPPNEAVYDFDVIMKKEKSGHTEIGVSVFPRDLVESYVAAFKASGIRLLSLEVEARSVARAVSSGTGNDPITLLVDFGRARTGFSVLKRGIPIFSSTVAVGGSAMTRTLVEKTSLSPKEAEQFKDEKGLITQKDEKHSGREVLLAAASAFADEVVRHYHYWDTRRNEHGDRVTPVECVLLVGGSANLKGLSDYIAARVQAAAILPNVWRHVSSFEDYIPPIDSKTSMQYVTAVGLALRGT